MSYLSLFFQLASSEVLEKVEKKNLFSEASFHMRCASDIVWIGFFLSSLQHSENGSCMQMILRHLINSDSRRTYLSYSPWSGIHQVIIIYCKTHCAKRRYFAAHREVARQIITFQHWLSKLNLKEICSLPHCVITIWKPGAHMKYNYV